MDFVYAAPFSKCIIAKSFCGGVFFIKALGDWVMSV